ncbi:MAG TPA: hypothetical protein VM327_07160 [Candidatus Thermoplasmatota archaeon]|nr:hypothetical protein [Candidatus Thermoplasmatota archaeon]
MPQHRSSRRVPEVHLGRQSRQLDVEADAESTHGHKAAGLLAGIEDDAGVVGESSKASDRRTGESCLGVCGGQSQVAGMVVVQCQDKRFTKLYFFSPDKKLRKVLDPKGEVTQFIDDEVYVFVLYVNVEVTDTDDVAWWLYNQYSGRWGILEAYFRALVYEATKSQAQSIFWKNWWYLMATLALNSKAIWRLLRRKDLDQPDGWTKDLDYQQFLVAARANIERRMNDKAVKSG